MSTLTSQLVSASMAVKLKESGIPQEAVFFWVKDGDKWRVVQEKTAVDFEEKAAAFSVAELGDFFPDDFNISYKRVARDSYQRASVDCFDPNEGKTWKLYPKRTNEADARAHMLDYLVTGGFIHI